MKLNLLSLAKQPTWDDTVAYILERNNRELVKSFTNVQELEKFFFDTGTASIVHTLRSGWLDPADRYFIKTDASANTVTIQAPAGETIGGGSITLATQYDKVTLTFSQGVWYRLA